MARRGGIPSSFPMLVDLGLKNEANRTGALVSTRVRLVITPVFTSSDIPQSVWGGWRTVWGSRPRTEFVLDIGLDVSEAQMLTAELSRQSTLI